MSTNGFQDALHKFFEGKIDFQGQKLVEQIIRVSLVVLSIVSFGLGFVTQSLKVLFGTFSIGTIILTFAIVPHWPVYNQHRVKWQPIRPTKKQQ